MPQAASCAQIQEPAWQRNTREFSSFQHQSCLYLPSVHLPETIVISHWVSYFCTLLKVAGDIFTNRFASCQKNCGLSARHQAELLAKLGWQHLPRLIL
jgi:hypothetical protein